MAGCSFSEGHVFRSNRTYAPGRQEKSGLSTSIISRSESLERWEFLQDETGTRNRGSCMSRSRRIAVRRSSATEWLFSSMYSKRDTEEGSSMRWKKIKPPQAECWIQHCGSNSRGSVLQHYSIATVFLETGSSRSRECTCFGFRYIGCRQARGCRFADRTAQTFPSVLRRPPFDAQSALI